VRPGIFFAQSAFYPLTVFSMMPRRPGGFGPGGDPERQSTMSGDQDTALQAMNIVVDAYEAALGKGVPPAVLGTAALSSAIGLLVQIHGAEVVAKMIEELPAKIRRGEFTQPAP
jgi:hypothetical protein